jgi:EAL domain-containing protein (putative c-di-GMP-specific phosphodiesterase class I)
MAIGAATTETRPGSSAGELLSRARLAMHAAQTRAGHQVVIATPTLQVQAETQYQQEAELVVALEEQQLTAYLQPIINLRNRQVVGFECLARWIRADGSMLTPSHFLAQAHDAGLTAAVDLQVLQASLRAAQPLAEALGPGQTLLLSANLSAQLVDSEPCQRRLLDLISHHPLPHGVNLQLELLEEALNEADPGLEDLLQHLADRHVQIAIDDFGTGYSSLSRLHNLPIDAIKVDRSFVQRINAPGKPSNHLLDMLVAIGSDLKIRLTAEGVETEEQRQWLLEHGIDQAQGYLFSEPLSVADAIDCLRHQNRPGP